MANPENITVIHLVRDGRAVAASFFRKGKHTISEAANEWKIKNLHSLNVQKSTPKSQKIIVRYEDVCLKPDFEMSRIFEFLKLPSNNKYALGGREHHLIPGNPLLFNLSKEKNTELKYDERWIAELKKEDIDIFDKFAGKLNRKFGYQ